MLLTAHSGANGTAPNGVEYFEAMKNLNVDVIEVDIRRLRGEFYLTHDKTFFPKNKGFLPVSYAFEFIKRYDFKINCDLKAEGYVPYVTELAEKYGVEDRLIITGSAADKKDLAAMKFGDLYVNADYLPKAQVKNVKKMREILDKMGPRAKGINVSYKKVSDEFFFTCEKENVPVSLFTLNEEKLLEKYATFPAIVNITTCLANEALRILGKEIRK